LRRSRWRAVSGLATLDALPAREEFSRPAGMIFGARALP